MSSSGTRSQLAAMMLLAAMTSGCVYPRMSRFSHTCERVCVVSSMPSSVVTRYSSQPSVRHETIDRSAGDTGLGEVATDDAAEKTGAPVEAAPIPSGLTIDVVDLADPVPKGGKLTYKIIVSNDGALTERNVSVVATVSQGMLPIRSGTDDLSGQTLTGQALTGQAITGQIVRFDPVPQIGPGQQREYQVVVRTLAAGQQTLRVELTSDNLSQPLDAEAATKVLP